MQANEYGLLNSLILKTQRKINAYDHDLTIESIEAGTYVVPTSTAPTGSKSVDHYHHH